TSSSLSRPVGAARRHSRDRTGATGSALLLVDLLQLGDVDAILRSTGRRLGGDQVVEAEIVRRYGPVRRVGPAFPRLCEGCDAFQAGQEIDAHGRDSELEDAVRIDEILYAIAEVRSTEEGAQCSQGTLRIAAFGIEVDLKVHRRPGSRVKRDRVGARD